jgi:hypothetical protein
MWEIAKVRPKKMFYKKSDRAQSYSKLYFGYFNGVVSNRRIYISNWFGKRKQ